MSRKADSGSSRGFDDVIGVVLLLAALLLLLAQLSFDPHDITYLYNPPIRPAHNFIGPLGAYIAWWVFLLLGVVGYFLPFLVAVFGAAYMFGFLHYLRERLQWSLLWSFGLLISLTGLLFLADRGGILGKVHESIGANSAGGGLGYLTYGESARYQWGFSLLGPIGATIVYAALCLVSLLFLTAFQLGDWLRNRVAGAEEKSTAATPEEAVLERKARDLQKQAKKLQEEVERTGDRTAERSGIGADLQPVPEPTVRDLSVPQAKPRAKKTAPEPAKEITPVVEGEVIPAREVAAATTAEVLGKEAEPKPDEKDAAKADTGDKPADKPPEPAPEPVVHIADGSAPPAPLPKPKLAPRKPKPITVASTPLIGNYQLPSLDFLQHPDLTVKPTESKEELMANARLMQQTLGQFDIDVSLGDITKGPTITRYELHPAPGVKLEKITALSNNIAAALKAERIHILAPVPGKSSVGVEVPNAVKTKVIMRDLLESEEWRNTKCRIPLALGKDVYGHPIVADLAEMPHLLIAGSTGSGKSVCINAIIASLLYKFSPDQLRFVMIDPKVVELQHYNTLPHLVVPVVTDPKKVILALRWVVNEMEKRYQIFAKVGVRNIATFNSRPNKKIVPQEPELPLMARKEKVEPGAEGFAVEVDEQIVVPREDDIVIPEKLSYIVVIIDELADLMLVAPADVEMAIARITQMARAAGIHCIVATQRPSVDVITGVIKANIPARIAFQVAAKVDSRTILDAMGADKLLGKGDMLYLPPGSAKLIRAQGALITDQEIQDVVDFIAKQGKPNYDVEIHQQLSKPANTFGDESGIDEDEEIIQQCIEVIRSEQKASVSLMQRRLRLGYTRAARIMDELENRGIVGPSKGAEPRDILIDLDGGGADGGGQSAV
ncbi:MAG TPA: DNA translocase FtsK [Verrucomicrobiae bacterium]|jgi:S-DNA-T family DNA segregation ATPase FtsK/SpoIIIE|nr:DNA translocase FtsK [Verrucomicrobiae bacterium]